MKKRCHGCNKWLKVGHFVVGLDINISTQLVRLANPKESILLWTGEKNNVKFKFDMCGTCSHKIVNYFAQIKKSSHYVRSNKLKFRRAKNQVNS